MRRFEAYLATDLTRGEPNLESSGHGLIAKPVSVDELRRLIASGRMVDAGTIATLSLAGLLRHAQAQA